MQTNTSISCVVVKRGAGDELLYRTATCAWSPELTDAEVMDEDAAISRIHQLQGRYPKDNVDYRII